MQQEEDTLAFLVTSDLGFTKLVDPAVAHVGSARECEIHLDHPSVARLHARFYTRHGQLWVEAVRGAAGVYARGLRVTTPTVVDDGDVVRIGDFELTIERLSRRESGPRRDPLVTATAAAPHQVMLDGLRAAIARDAITSASEIAELLAETLCIASTRTDPETVSEATNELLLLSDLTQSSRWLDAILLIHAARQIRLDPYALQNLARRYHALPATNPRVRHAYVAWAEARVSTREERAALDHLLLDGV